MAEDKYCKSCSKELKSYELNNGRKECESCRCKSAAIKITSTSEMDKIFIKKWVSNLFVKYYEYLQEIGMSNAMCLRHIRKVRDILIIADKELFKINDINEEWIEEAFHRVKGSKRSYKGFCYFLETNKILENRQERMTIERIQDSLNTVPKGFRRLLEIYVNNRIELRNRHITNNAKKPLSLKTIITDLEVFRKFINWIQLNYPMNTSWDLIEEYQYNEYFLTLTIRHREVVRKDMYALLRFAKSKKLIFHIPIADLPAREFPSSIEPLGIEEQKKIALILRTNIYENPLACLISSLCFYHGLSSLQIRNIKIQDVDIDNRLINIRERSPVFLASDELVTLKAYIEEKNLNKKIRTKNYLITGKYMSYQDKPVSKRYITNAVRSLTGYNPKVLRITCYTVFSSRYGPQLLVECFGLSMTQASRYGKLEEYLIEEELREQIK
ncbi:site-specific integrase [Cellulosilyticum sp. WCF-2]|uniref:site-specific integrase n=1 Tax=Cellulosilyticum sp. WCF-2 TaxID=2497860 RepID=UPI000F8C6845|nr:site-specific integrase [Cellulosilyticum sp. WCF-2]QEH69197.1 site-specific integrase [Cellulosilyticum sp. WCF-2]